MWREIDAKNFSKSLDHIGINFKQRDKKDTAPKALIAHIEATYREQREKPSELAHRYQFDFSFKDQKVFKDVVKLIWLTIKHSGLGDDEAKLLRSIREFVNTFFVLDDVLEDDLDDDSDGSEANDTDTEMEDDAGTSALARPKIRSNSLRRNVLTRGTGVNGRSNGKGARRSKLASGDVLETDEDDGAGDGDTESVNDFGARDVSRLASPTVEVASVATEGTKDNRDTSMDSMDVDTGIGASSTPPVTSVPTIGRSKRPRYSLYANSVIYVFFRLFQARYAGLQCFL